MRSSAPKIIWFMWLQGLDAAPDIVRSCYQSWLHHNPGWIVRVVDKDNLAGLLPDGTVLDMLEHKRITPASFSDLVRLELLTEYGGVWADATTLCVRPLDRWLPGLLRAGVFMFSNPGRDRHVASWFIAAAAGNPLIGAWRALAWEYWAGRAEGDDYYWLHHCFTELLLRNDQARSLWDQVPVRRARTCHALQRVGMTSEEDVTRYLAGRIPMQKLSFKNVDLEAAASRPQSVLAQVYKRYPPPPLPAPDQDPITPSNGAMAGLALSTDNLGDHVQLYAAERLLSLHGIEITRRHDRDHGLHSAKEPATILLSGWFKHGNHSWPPSPQLDPIYISFHIRLHQAPVLMSEGAVAHYRQHMPIHCRDSVTAGLLRDAGIEAEVSRCFAATFPTRVRGAHGDKVFVVSRDERILEDLPPDLTDFEFIKHYSGEKDHDRNMARARALLDRYRDEAGLVITTLLHCALPCLAMGVPTILCWPRNSAKGNKSDRERFSALEGLTEIHSLDELKSGKLRPSPSPIAEAKLHLRDLLTAALDRHGIARRRLDLSALAPPMSLTRTDSERWGAKELTLRSMLGRRQA